MAGRRGLRQARRRSHRRLRQDHRPWTYPRSPSTPSLHKAPCGGEGTGPNPTDRAKIGRKWSVATDLFADPHRLGHRRSEPRRTHLASRRLPRTAAVRLDLAPGPWLRQLPHRRTLPGPGAHRHRLRQEETQERSEDQNRSPSDWAGPLNAPTPGSQTNFGQPRCNTDRFSKQRLGQVALAVALILTVKLVKGAKRWTN